MMGVYNFKEMINEQDDRFEILKGELKFAVEAVEL